MDYFPPLGDGQGYTGLELLLMSLAGCSATSIVYLLRKMEKNVAGFSVRAKGIRREVHPTSFHTIALEFLVTSGDADDASVKRAIHLSEESLCPVWALLKNNVEIKTEYRIVVP
jgi:putative redox protein